MTDEELYPVPFVKVEPKKDTPLQLLGASLLTLFLVLIGVNCGLMVAQILTLILLGV